MQNGTVPIYGVLRPVTIDRATPVITLNCETPFRPGRNPSLLPGKVIASLAEFLQQHFIMQSVATGSNRLARNSRGGKAECARAIV